MKDDKKEVTSQNTIKGIVDGSQISDETIEEVSGGKVEANTNAIGCD